MRTANQLTLTTFETSPKLNPKDPLKIIFDNIDWSFIHALAKGRYSTSPQGAEGYDPVSLYKAQLLICLGEVTLDRKSLPQPFATMPVCTSSVVSISLSLLKWHLHQLP